jgi:hypothetical protein
MRTVSKMNKTPDEILEFAVFKEQMEKIQGLLQATENEGPAGAEEGAQAGGTAAQDSRSCHGLRHIKI